MDLVISDVSTVEEDEEPLFEITKVTVLKDNTPKSRDVRPPGSTYNKTCYVPLCPNSSRSTPEKMFITIPVNPERRKQWLEAVGKSADGRNPKSPMFCCQDHFNLRKDMRNYEEHLRKGRIQMLLHPTAVPHVFLCNNYGHLKRNQRIEALRRLHENREVEEEIVDCEQEEVTIIKLPRRQCPLQESHLTKRRKVSGKRVFIEVPTFQYNKYPKIKENGMDTIVIDDSD